MKIIVKETIMNLRYKPDWEETKQRYRAWWAHDAIDRCTLAVTAPRVDIAQKEPPRYPPDILQRWTDLDFIARLNEYRFETTFYGGEAFPVWNGGYPGHTSLSTYLGGRIELDARTGWIEPMLLEEQLDVASLCLDKESRWWRFTLALLECAAAESRGNSIPSIGAFGACGDTLASLRGSERFLYDLVDQPDRVRAADMRIMELWIEAYDAFYAVIQGVAEGSTCWFELWAPGKFYAVQNDFAYMISPAMFQEIFLPVIERQSRFLDYSVYHVDGIGNFAHVPALCELPRIQAFQIQAGAGKPSALHYLDVLKQVQRAGKNLHISLSPNEVETALGALSARGLFIDTACRTEAEARDLLTKAKQWSRDRKV